VAGLRKAHELYRPDGLPVVFDLQLEAEVLGCELSWADDGPPSVTSHPLAQGRTLGDLPRFSLDAGRIPLVLEATRRARRELPDVALYGLVCGPFTLALHLFGNDIFVLMFDDEDEVLRAVEFCAEVGKELARAYVEAGCDVIAVVDPMTSQISPKHFDAFVRDPVNAIFDDVHERGALGSMFVCGNATRVLDKLCATHCDNVSIDENIALSLAKELAEKHGCSFGGNLKLTTVLLMGTSNDARREAVSCLDVGGSTGFVLAPGCDLPYNVPQENVQAVAEVVHDEYQREIARTLEAAPTDSYDDVVPPEYDKLPEVVLDVVTLDSKTCPPCQYMVAAAERMAGRFSGKLRVVEHKITGRDGLGYMTKLGVGAIPTLCIDGKVAFASIIPDDKTLEEQVRAALRAKG
jgi:uroporphyrinogen decarboxylase